MRKNGRLFIVLGVGLACLAVALAFLMFRNTNQSKAVEKAPAPVHVVVAAKPIAPHQIIQEADLTDETVDKDLLTGGEIFAKSEVIGQAPKAGLVKGQRIKRADLEVSGLTNDIEKGMRAVTVPVDQLQLSGGLLREQDYVDVVFSVKVNLLYVLPSKPLELDTGTAADQTTVQAALPVSPPNDPAAYPYPGEAGSRFKIENPDKKGDPLAKVVLQDLKVLRVVGAPSAQAQQQQQQQQQQANAAANQVLVVLQMTDEQAEVMKFILDNGASFTFAVRAKDDHEKANTSGITYDLLVTNYQLPAPKSVRMPGEKQP
jgi:Flp pilus assembly protein CpaB